MAILLIYQKKNINDWITALQQELPGETIEVYPDVKNPADIDFVICLRANKGQFAQLPNVKVIQCYGAGVNYILDAGVLTEKMQLARVVDPELTNDMFEFVLSMILAKMKKLPLYLQQQMNKIFPLLSSSRM